MKTCYIIGAAELAIGRLRPSEGDFVIAADAGLLHLAKLHIKPDLMLGDFDSLGYVPSGENVEVCPVRKNDTDTMAALRRAVDISVLSLFSCIAHKAICCLPFLSQSPRYAPARRRPAFSYPQPDRQAGRDRRCHHQKIAGA